MKTKIFIQVDGAETAGEAKAKLKEKFSRFRGIDYEVCPAVKIQSTEGKSVVTEGAVIVTEDDPVDIVYLLDYIKKLSAVPVVSFVTSMIGAPVRYFEAPLVVDYLTLAEVVKRVTDTCDDLSSHLGKMDSVVSKIGDQIIISGVHEIGKGLDNSWDKAITIFSAFTFGKPLTIDTLKQDTFFLR